MNSVRPSFTTFEIKTEKELFLARSVVNEWYHRCNDLKTSLETIYPRESASGLLSDFKWYTYGHPIHDRIFVAVDDYFGSFQAVAVVKDYSLEDARVHLLLSNPKNYSFNEDNPYKIRGAATALLCHIGNIYPTLQLTAERITQKFYEHLGFETKFDSLSEDPRCLVDSKEFCDRHHKGHKHLFY